MLPAPASELDLPTLSLALGGDGPALARLYRRHHPLVLRMARRTLERFGLAEAPAELAAEVWLRLIDRGCRALRPFDPTRGSFSAFLRMVACQQGWVIARAWQRRATREAASAAAAPRSTCAVTVLHQRIFLERVLAAVPRISPLELTLLEESLVRRTPMPELALRLGYDVDVLRRRSERLRRRLRATARALAPEPVLAAA